MQWWDFLNPFAIDQRKHLILIRSIIFPSKAIVYNRRMYGSNSSSILVWSINPVKWVNEIIVLIMESKINPTDDVKHQLWLRLSQTLYLNTFELGKFIPGGQGTLNSKANSRWYNRLVSKQVGKQTKQQGELGECVSLTECSSKYCQRKREIQHPQNVQHIRKWYIHTTWATLTLMRKKNSS